jgi:parvulin-like peptidyl-prolyl isomerase
MMYALDQRENICKPPLKLVSCLSLLVALVATFLPASGAEPLQPPSDIVIAESDLGNIALSDIRLGRAFLDLNEEKATHFLLNEASKSLFERWMLKEAKRLNLDQNTSLRKSVKDLREREMLVRFLYDHVDQPAQISKEEIHQLYEQHRNEFVVPPTVRIRFIFLKAPESQPEEERAPAKKRLQEIRNRITAQGADFAEMAKKYSESPSAATGGDPGPIIQGESQYNPVILEKVFQTPLGKVSDIFESRHGFYILMPYDRQSTRTKTFDEAYAELSNRYTSPEQKKRAARLQEQLKRDLEKHFGSTFHEKLLDNPENIKDEQQPVYSIPERAQLTAGEMKRRWEAFLSAGQREGVAREPLLQRFTNEIRQQYYKTLAIQKAYEERYDRHEAVVRQVDLLERDSLLSAVDRHFAQQARATFTTPPDKVLQEYYQKNQRDFFEPPKKHIYELVIAPDMPQEVSKEAREAALKKTHDQIAKLRGTIRDQESLRAAARQAAQLSKNSTLNDLGWLTEAALKEYRTVARKLQQGQVSEPVFTGSGYAVLFVSEVKPAQPQSFDAAKNRIINQMEQAHTAQFKENLKKNVASEYHLRLSKDAVAKVRQALEKKIKQIGDLPVSD